MLPTNTDNNDIDENQMNEIIVEDEIVHNSATTTTPSSWNPYVQSASISFDIPTELSLSQYNDLLIEIQMTKHNNQQQSSTSSTNDDNEEIMTYDDIKNELMDACRYNDVDLVRAILSVYDELCYYQDSVSGNTPLHMAAANGNEDIVLLLLYVEQQKQEILDTTSQAQEGVTIQQQQQYDQRLVNIKNHSGNTSLHWAASNGKEDIVKILINEQPNDCIDVLHKNNIGHSILTEGFSSQNTNVVKYLLEHDSASEEKLLYVNHNMNIKNNIKIEDDQNNENNNDINNKMNEMDICNDDESKNNENNNEEWNNKQKPKIESNNNTKDSSSSITHSFIFGKFDENNSNNCNDNEQVMTGSINNDSVFVKIREIVMATSDTDIILGQTIPTDDTTGYGIWASSLISAQWMADIIITYSSIKETTTATNPNHHHNNSIDMIDFHKKNILELGAGCGVPGLTIAAANICNKVYLTDFNPKTIENLNYNIQLNDDKIDHDNQCIITKNNNRTKAIAINMNWHDTSTWPTDDKIHIVIGSDLIYQIEMVPVLFQTITKLLLPSKNEVNNTNNNEVDVGHFFYVAPNNINRQGHEEFLKLMLSESSIFELTSVMITPKKYSITNPLCNQDDDDFFLHFYELNSSNTEYNLYHFQTKKV